MSLFLITGVNRGIGEGLLRHYLEAGHEVDAIGRSAPSFPAAHGARFRFHACNLAHINALGEAYRAVATRLDTLISWRAT